MNVGPKVLASGAALVVFERLDSTSLEARRRVEAGARGPVFIVALEQTSGYGRRGSAWESRAGDLAATLLFEPAGPSERLGELSFVAALAVADIVAEMAPRIDIRFKWPNDVVAGGGKIAGLLLERLSGKSDRPLIALGVGINIVSKPEVAQYPTARLLDYADVAPEPVALVRRLDAAFDQWRRVWEREGFELIRAAWLGRATGLGRRILVQLPGETVEGVFKDLDKDGALLLETQTGERRITAGAILRT
jgi:BirA family biotin operon repressor/biotin-[acetyl-CoA-carboxylase] ligase